VQIQGLKETQVSTPQEMQKVIEYGHNARTTHSTKANDTSSRSHAICQVVIRQGYKFLGKLIICDLAGSERAQDCQSNNRQRRLEGAEINKSLLALKECIRAMHDKSTHIPFRASKLTLALRDSFITKNISSKIIMVACVCPGSNSTDHTINTLRYADRLKMKTNRTIDPSKAIYAPGEKPKKAATSQSNSRPQDSPKFGSKPSGLKSQKNVKHPPAPTPGNKWESRKKDVLNQQAPPIPAYPTSDSIEKAAPIPPRDARKRSSSRSKKTKGTRSIDVVNTSQASEHDSDQESDSKKQDRKRKKQDFDLMKSTLRVENKEEFINDEIFDYQEKVDDVLDLHDEILATHMNILKA